MITPRSSTFETSNQVYSVPGLKTHPSSICDLQEKFRPAIHEYSRVIATTQKMLRAAQILQIPVLATTQQRAKLGETCAELQLDAPGGVKTLVHADKSLFSMW
jgi:hypothetical protein